MAKTVVDMFESVEVHEENREHAVVSGGAFECVFNQIVKQNAIRQSSERVMVRQE